MMRKIRLWLLRWRYNGLLALIHSDRGDMDLDAYTALQIDALRLLQRINAARGRV